MDEKISLEAISLYGDSFAEKILKDFFSGKDQITGKEILSLSAVHQVNLFVVRELFKTWREETRKQKSIYFDNEHPEVKEALSSYMSAVSNHILIEQRHFAPLLKKAVSQTLLVIFNPYDFFSMLISGKNNQLEITSFREEIKYLKINKAPLERMLQKLEEKGIRDIAGNEAFAVLDQILEEVNFTPEDVDEYIQKFSEVVPLNPERFYVAQVETPAPAPKVNKPRQEAPIERPADKPVEKPSNISVQASTHSSVNEKVASAHQPAVMDNLGKISKIRESLSINQKFMFTKVLFYGDFDSFSRVIDDLDNMSDMKSAVTYLEKHSSSWDRDSNEFHEFMELVEKRFG
jgi:hypothetical protein